MKMKMSTMAAIVGAGALSWMMIKKINPDMINDMKHMMKKSAHKMIDNLENMD